MCCRNVVVYGLLMMLGLAGWAVTAEAQSIVRVAMRQEEGAHADPPGRGIQDRYLPAFIDDLHWPGEVVYDAHWNATEAGLTGPVAVTLAYRQAGRRDVRRLIVRYPEGARGKQIARFRITEDDIRRYGAVTAWRIQLRQHNRVLDESKTGRWR